MPGTPGEATLVAWTVEVGDQVREDELICIVELDGGQAGIASSAGGLLVSKLTQVGEVLRPESPIARIEVAETAEPEIAPPDMAGFRSPAVRRLAREHDLDLSGLSGTGLGGRVTLWDVRVHLEAHRLRFKRHGTPAEDMVDVVTAG